MNSLTTPLRIAGGAILTAAALAACSDSPLTPADDPAFDVATAGATVTEFAATDLFTGLADPGMVEVQGKFLAIRGVVVTSRLEGTDPRIAGNARITINEQLSLADGSGRGWGKFEVVADVGGVWEGTFEGRREPTGSGQWVATIELVGRGNGGTIEGLHFRAVELVYSNDIYLGPHFGQTTGTILQPGN
jgi:hypothetical protein